MNLAVYNITLDIHKNGSQVFLPMKRGDTGRKIVASLCENGIPYKLEGCSAVFTAVKPDGKFIYNDCEVDVENNVIIYPVTLQTTAAEGMVNCQFKLIGNDGKVIATPEFGIIVEKTVYNEEPIVESSEEFAALTSLYAEITKKLANGELKGEKGETGAQGPQGPAGEKGAPGEKGDSYELTESDRQEIANIILNTEVKEKVKAVFDDVHNYAQSLI